MRITINKFEPDTVGDLIAHLSQLPFDMPVQDVFGELACFRVLKDVDTSETCLEVA